jgi:hypothetical protein
MSFSTPILFITFNRLDTSERVFNTIRAVKPEKLYLFSDGPRKHIEDEVQQVQLVREWLQRNVDWPCDLQINFLKENIGTRYAIGAAVNWMFEQEEQGIVLEHDCLPHPSFFPFCHDLLAKYKEEEKVMHISGNNYLFGRISHDTSYYFSQHNISWGWATWKRAWQYYDADMKAYPMEREGLIKRLSNNKRIRKYWYNILDRVYSGDIQTWDFQWTFSMWQKRGVAIVPENNLVANIGYGAKAIHTANQKDKLAKLPLNEMKFPLKHPHQIVYDTLSDDYYIGNIIYPVFFLRLRFVQQFLQGIGFYKMK